MAIYTLRTEEGDRLRRELQEDADELSQIDGVPRPKDLATGGTISFTGGSVLTSSSGHTSWIAPSVKYKIPAGTKFTLDPVTGEITNVDEIELTT